LYKALEPSAAAKLRALDKAAELRTTPSPVHADSSKVARWIDAVSKTRSIGRLHFLLDVLDASIDWSKSAENAVCS
jgi:hypothetical protein